MIEQRFAELRENTNYGRVLRGHNAWAWMAYCLEWAHWGLDR